MNEQLDRIDAMLKQLTTEVQSIKDSLQTTAVQEPVKWHAKLNKHLLTYAGKSVSVSSLGENYLPKEAYIATRATPELAKADSIALHKFSTLLAYRAEFWPDFVLQLQDSVIGEKVCEVAQNVSGSYCIAHFPLNLPTPLSVLFPISAKEQLQATLDNGLLDLPNN